MESKKPRRHVVVLNQFALPLSEGGGTRHTELFSRLEGWSHNIIAGNRNHYNQQVYATDEESFTLVAVTSQKGGAAARLTGWIAYSSQAFLRTLKTPDLDAVYASTPHPLTPLAGWAAAKIRGVPLVLEVRDLWPESIVSTGKLKPGSFAHKVLKVLERFSVRQASQVIGVTEGWEDHFRELGATPYHVVPNGAEFNQANYELPRQTLRELRPEVDGPFGVFAGAHGPKDGIDSILDAAAAHPNVGFTLIGCGAMKGPAQERARREQLTNVKFVDPVPKDELSKALAAFDFGVHAVSPLSVFSKGMSPNKLFDYLANDLPVVSNAGRALDWIIGAGAIGVVTDNLSTSVAKYLESGGAERDAWAEHRRYLMSGPYSRTNSARRLESILDAATNRARGKAPAAIDGQTAPRVVHVSSAHGPTDNRILRKEARALAEAGLDVNLVTRGPQQRIVASVKHYVIRNAPTSRIPRMVLGPWKAIRTAMRLKPRVLHLHDPELIPLGLAVEAFTTTKVLFDAHEDLSAQVMGKHYLPRAIRPIISRAALIVEKLAGLGLTGIIAATPSIASIYPSKKTEVVKNFPWKEDYPDAMHGDLGQSRTYTFGYVGAMSKIRGIDEMISATEGYRLLLAGTADEYATAAIERAGDHVEHLGTVPADQIPGILRQIDAGLVLLHDLPNYRESIPTKLIEYMASGVPFIATDFPSWRKLVQRDDICKFVDVSRLDSVRAGVESLASSRDEGREMGLKGRELFETELSFDAQVPALIAAYERVLGRIRR